ncbi:MAG: radical SAM protein [Chloroflexota bacterium]
MQAVRHLTVPGIGEVYFNKQPYHLTISENLKHHYSFDPTGRLLTSYLNGVNYRRGLNNAVLRRERTDASGKTRRMLSATEIEALVNDIRERVASITKHVEDSDLADLLPWLQAILAWDYPRLCQEHALFCSIYKPISILPPDQYQAVVLQAAEGCSWNRCTFCTLYRDRAFRVKSPDDFRLHIHQVKNFIGEAIGLRKSLFLGDANALIMPQPRLLELLRIVNEEFPIGKPIEEVVTFDGIYSFLDIFGAERKTQDDYHTLREQGVKRIYVGLETGDPELFALLNKPGSPQTCIEAVHLIKQAGIAVGIILLAGVGGDVFATQHITHSIACVTAMNLTTDDLIYVSPLVVSGMEAYTQQMRDRGACSLTQYELLQQIAFLKAGLRDAYVGGPKVSLYHIEEFIY